jgi:anti-sigma B factor antagonist
VSVVSERSFVEVRQRADSVDRARNSGSGLRVDVQPERGGVRVRPAGELDIATIDELEATLDELARLGFGRIVLDLRELEFMGSCGLRLLVLHTQRARRGGYEFTLIDGPPAVQRVIEICGLREQLAFGRAQGSTSPRRIA